jgi:hypothetical protein
MKSHAKIDQRGLAPPLFWTATYPRQYDPNPRRWKRDLKAMAKRLQRHFPEIAIEWRLEAQKRGAPHFHCLLYNVDFIKKRWMARQWYEVVGSGDKRHLRRGSRIEKIRTIRGVQSYVSKYMTKPGDQEHDFGPGVRPGRFWGIIGRAYLPRTPVELDANDMAFHKVRRVIYGLRRSRQKAQPKHHCEASKGHCCARRYVDRWSGSWLFADDYTQSQIALYAMSLDPPPELSLRAS